MKTESYSSMPRGLVPNSRFPVLVYRDAAPRDQPAMLQMFQQNGWLNNWVYPGIYPYGHFHSTTHECLGCAVGWMEVEIFGEGGERLRLEAGDVLVMPAGVSHNMTDQSDGVVVVGGYPQGRDWDNIPGCVTERRTPPRRSETDHDVTHSQREPRER